MSEKIVVGLISASVSLIVALLANYTNRIITKEKNRKEDFLLIFNQNKSIFKVILDINRNTKVNYYDLRKQLASEDSGILFLYSKKSGKLFTKLYKELNKDGIELQNNINNIRRVTKKIVKWAQKCGGKICDIN